MMRRYRAIAKWLVLGSLVVVSQVDAQRLRDPTTPPAAVGSGTETGDVRLPDTQFDAPSVIVRDGRPYLVQGGRLYGQGQQVGQTRIERITETAVWLRDGGVLRKQPLFPGVQLQILQSKTLPSAGPFGASSAPLKPPPPEQPAMSFIPIIQTKKSQSSHHE